MSDQDSHEITRSYIQLANGTSIGHYRVIQLIGAGGMGEVYLAEDTSLHRNVAIKFLSSHLCQIEEYRKRFIREAQAAARLDHPNIVAVYEVGEFQGRPFFSMQYVHGQTLHDLIRSSEIPLERVADLAIQMCEGLLKAHSAGVVHRDIKPANILLDTDGHPHIVDFGLASCTGTEQVSRSGARMGTIGYMSPEQIRGERLDARTDLFSLGTVIYEMIAARRPFSGETDDATQRLILTSPAQPLARYRADVPANLQSVVDRALEKDAAVRYQSAADMLADLRRLRRRSSDSVQRQDTMLQPSMWRQLDRRYVLATVVLLAVALVWLRYDSRLGDAGKQSHLAVLPFTNLAAQPGSQEFCDGLMETLTSNLTQLAGSEGSLLIVPASEVRQKEIQSVAQARKVFGTNLVVTGSVQQFGNRMRTTLNLVDAETARQLRSSTIDQQADDIASLQDTSVAEVARLLDIQLRPESRRILVAGRTASSRAYRLYLQGRGYFQRCDDLRCLDSAQQLFDAAIAQDTNYALAYAGLGDVNWRRFSLTNDANWVMPAIRYSNRALELDDHLAPVLITLGIVHRTTGQYQEAVNYLQRALQVDSMNNDASIQLASAYELMGRTAEAESMYRRSTQLRPQYWRSHYYLARFYAFQGRKEDAHMQLATAETLAPVATYPYGTMGSLCVFLGEYDHAKYLLQRSLDIAPNYVAYSNLGTIYQMEEKYDQAVDMYERALQLNDKDYRVWSNLAWMYKMRPASQARAITAYRRAIVLAEQQHTVSPNDPALLCYLADCYWQTGEQDQAVALAQQASQLSPEDVEVMVRAGIIFEEAHRRDEALAFIGKAVRKGFPPDRIKETVELKDLVADPRFDSVLSGSQ